MSTEVEASSIHGIPKAPFVEDVDKFLGGVPAEVMMNQMQENYRKYKMIEARLQNSKQVLKGKIPEIERTLNMVKFLNSKKVSFLHLDN